MANPESRKEVTFSHLVKKSVQWNCILLKPKI